MILVLNTMKKDLFAVSFDRVIQNPIRDIGAKADIIRVSKGDAVPGISGYSHIIISGSEASATDDNTWDTVLTDTIHEIVRQEKPLLGICYGHQFMVRALAGKNYVRKSETPEFGWVNIDIVDNQNFDQNFDQNPLFKGISGLFSMVSHYDEVYNLPGEFKILASTPRCAVHAYQYKELPVWGFQFHPEYGIAEADEIFNIVRRDDPLFETYLFNIDRVTTEKYLQNQRIIENFLNVI